MAEKEPTESQEYVRDDSPDKVSKQIDKMFQAAHERKCEDLKRKVEEAKKPPKS
jgi:hypothetical protein